MMYWPTINGTSWVEPELPVEQPTVVASEWIHLAIHSDGSKAGTRVTWHGNDITGQVNLDFVEQPPITERAPKVDIPCPECRGGGWSKTEYNKSIPCKACYGRGR